MNYTILAATLAPASRPAAELQSYGSLTDGTITPDGGSGQSFNFGSSDHHSELRRLYCANSWIRNANLENTTSLAGQVCAWSENLQGSVGLSRGFDQLRAAAPSDHSLGTATPSSRSTTSTFDVDFKDRPCPRYRRRSEKPPLCCGGVMSETSETANEGRGRHRIGLPLPYCSPLPNCGRPRRIGAPLSSKLRSGIAGGHRRIARRIGLKSRIVETQLGSARA